MASDRAVSEPNASDDEVSLDFVGKEQTDATAQANVRGEPANAAESLPPKPEAMAEPAPPSDNAKVTKKRAKRPAIDLDAAIQDAAAAMKAAQKKVNEAKAQAKNERRKKQRLLKKAASLNAEDLERIAVLKRCGWAQADQIADRVVTGELPSDPLKEVAAGSG